MTDGMLSQDEINALLGNIDLNEPDSDNDLSPEEIDAIGEIGNISMGTAATTLFSLLNHKVLITTPKVEVITQEDFRKIMDDDLIAVSVNYTVGLTGANLLFLNERNVRIITDLMMGGEGNPAEEELSEFHLSAIAEAMNQMVGSSSTSMSQMFAKKVDISPPQAMQVQTDIDKLQDILSSDTKLVKISFRMQILENIIDSELMQIIPMHLAKELVQNLMEQNVGGNEPAPVQPAPVQPAPVQPAPVQPAPAQPVAPPPMQPAPQQPMQQPDPMQGGYYPPPQAPMQGGYYPPPQAPMQGGYYPPPQAPMQGQQYYAPPQPKTPVEAKNIEFPAFDRVPVAYPKENMDVLMDVPLEVSVELGRAHKKIVEILELGPGSIIELNKLVGEPVDVLVNGKFIAKGEVVVIDENFGIRITDIINPENRI